MKLLNDPIFNLDLSEELSNKIKNDGFKGGKNDSYCYKEYNKENDKWENYCLKNNISSESFIINIYIFSDTIGVDIDYDCGGNMTNCMWEFKNEYEFKRSYDNMVQYVNTYR